MIKLVEITEENWLDAAALSVKDEQKVFVAPSVGILARGYVYRGCGGRIFTVELDGRLIGLALVREFTDEPLGYDLQQLMIDLPEQGKGYGTEALRLILAELGRERKYDCVEVCVKRGDAPALRVYEKVGFVDTGYVDEDAPDSLNLIYRFR